MQAVKQVEKLVVDGMGHSPGCASRAEFVRLAAGAYPDVAQHGHAPHPPSIAGSEWLRSSPRGQVIQVAPINRGLPF
jgi:hypothetical protein